MGLRLVQSFCSTIGYAACGRVSHRTSPGHTPDHSTTSTRSRGAASVLGSSVSRPSPAPSREPRERVLHLSRSSSSSSPPHSLHTRRLGERPRVGRTGLRRSPYQFRDSCHEKPQSLYVYYVITSYPYRDRQVALLDPSSHSLANHVVSSNDFRNLELPPTHTFCHSPVFSASPLVFSVSASSFPSLPSSFRFWCP